MKIVGHLNHGIDLGSIANGKRDFGGRVTINASSSSMLPKKPVALRGVGGVNMKSKYGKI